jgi:uncharacterized protein (TIGR02145 family)
MRFRSSFQFLLLLILVFSCKEDPIPVPVVPPSGNALELNTDPASLRYEGNRLFVRASVSSRDGYQILTRGFCFGKSAFPKPGKDSVSLSGEGSGTFESSFFLPDFSTDWFARPFAVSKSSSGKVDTSFGNQLNIRPYHRPKSIQTQAFSTDSIRISWAGIEPCKIAGLESVLQKGVCWSLRPGDKPSGNNFISLTSADSLGLSTFISGLQPGTLYYFRAYAVNAADTSFGPDFGCSTGFKDSEDNFYPTILIGKQVWMASNLRVARFADGTAIENNPDNARWDSIQTPACASSLNESVFGKFYNHYAIAGDRQLCPVGWKIPVRTDWDSLFQFLGGWEVAGNALKPVTTAWGPIAEGQGGSGFNALPAGKKTKPGPIAQAGSFGYWWMNSSLAEPAGFRINNLDKGVFIGSFQANEGMAVRCLKKP